MHFDLIALSPVISCSNLIPQIHSIIMTAASKRGKAIDTDGPTPKFLYAILKQLDLKTVRILSSKT